MRQIVLELPEEVALQAEQAARSARLPLETYLVRRVGDRDEERAAQDEIDYWDAIDLSNLPDAALTAHIRTPVAPSIGDRLNALQEACGERTLTGNEQAELERLSRVVHTSTMLKAIALQAWKDRHGALPETIEADW